MLIEQTDAVLINVGDTVTFINWGNFKILDITTSTSGKIAEIQVDLNLENTVKNF